MKRRVMCIFVLLGFGFPANPANAILIYNDGLTHEVSTTVYEDIHIYDSPLGEPTLVKLLTGGDTVDIDVFQNSRFQMTGGVISDGTLSLHDYSRAEVSGGSIDDDPLWIGDFSRLTITGGDFTQLLRVLGNSQVFIHGSNFQIDGMPVGYGPVTVPVGMLTGTLLNGQIRSLFTIRDSATVILIPEPATLLLFGLGGLILRRLKFKKRVRMLNAGQRRLI
jgi:hypothetical protein